MWEKYQLKSAVKSDLLLNVHVSIPRKALCEQQHELTLTQSVRPTQRPLTPSHFPPLAAPLYFGARQRVCGATLPTDSLMLLQKLVLWSGQKLDGILNVFFLSFFFLSRMGFAALPSSSSVIFASLMIFNNRVGHGVQRKIHCQLLCLRLPDDDLR